MVGRKESLNALSLSRRKLLTSAAAVSTSMTGSFSPGSPGAPDPIVPLWQNWQRLRARAYALCRRWQEMENHLMRTVGFPQVFVPSPDGGRVTCAQSHAEIDLALAESGCSPEIGASLHAEFAARRAQWSFEAERLGFDRAKLGEDEAWDEEAEAVRAVFRTTATTLAGVEIKIAMMVHLCSAGSDDPKFPLPQLRSTLADARRLRRSLDALRC